MVARIPSILRNQIARDEQISRRSGWEDTGLGQTKSIGLYQVGVVNVLSATVTGSFLGLPPDDFIIRPGVGVGRVLLGNNRSEVLALLGEPRETSLYSELDSWQSGDESLTVSYAEGTVIQISVTSPMFHTAMGLTVASTSRVFLKAFPGSKKQCWQSTGGSAYLEWTTWDAISQGIALQKGVDNTLIVHPAKVEAIQEGDGGEPCKP